MKEEELIIKNQSPKETEEIIELSPFKQKLKSRYPDREFETDEDWDNAGLELAETIEKYGSSEEAINAVFTAHPELFQIFADLLDGASLPIAFNRNLDIEDFMPKEGDDDFEEVSKIYSEKKAKRAKNEETQAEVDKNAAESWERVDAFIAEKGLTEEQKQAIIDQIYLNYENLLYGKITPEMLDGAYKALNYDSDINAAAKAAEINGRNQNIQKKIEKEKTDVIGDSIPVIESLTDIESPKKRKSVIESAFLSGHTDYN